MYAYEPDVGDRVAPADEELAAGEVALHGVERDVAGRALGFDLVGVALGLPRIDKPETDDGDRRLVLVLLEEEPLEHLRPLERVGG